MIFKQYAGRAQGYSFIVAIFLSTLILTVGLSAAEMVLKELNFSADMLLNEKAYYAAESGVETALMSLQEAPVQTVSAEEIALNGASFSPLIDNTVEVGGQFEFSLEPLQSNRFRLLQDTDGSLGYTPQFSAYFDVTVTPSTADWQWKTLCQDASGQTQALQNTLSGGNFLDFLYSDRAEARDQTGTTVLFRDWVSGVVPESCFFSVQNLSAQPIEVSILPQSNPLAPLVAVVESVGRAGERQKLIRFDYAQQGLSGLFDFVFFHWEE